MYKNRRREKRDRVKQKEYERTIYSAENKVFFSSRAAAKSEQHKNPARKTDSVQPFYRTKFSEHDTRIYAQKYCLQFLMNSK